MKSCVSQPRFSNEFSRQLRGNRQSIYPDFKINFQKKAYNRANRMQNKDIKVEYSWRYVEGKPELIIQKRYNNGSDEAKDVTTLKLIDHAALTAKWPHIGATNPKVVIDLSCKLKNCELCQHGSKIMLRYGIKKNHGW